MLKHNEALDDTTRALRKQQGAPPPDYDQLDFEITQLEAELKDLIKQRPGEYKPKNSPLRAIETALRCHRIVLDTIKGNPPTELGYTPKLDRVKLYYWRMAYLSRMVARERLLKK